MGMERWGCYSIEIPVSEDWRSRGCTKYRSGPGVQNIGELSGEKLFRVVRGGGSEQLKLRLAHLKMEKIDLWTETDLED
jgi:hypothetical protein